MTNLLASGGEHINVFSMRKAMSSQFNTVEVWNGDNMRSPERQMNNGDWDGSREREGSDWGERRNCLRCVLEANKSDDGS